MPFPGFPLFLRLFPDFPALSAKKSPCFTAFLSWKQGDCSLFIYFSALRLDQTVGVVLSLVNDVYFVGLCIAEYKEGVSKKFHLYAGIFRIHPPSRQRQRSPGRVKVYFCTARDKDFYAQLMRDGNVAVTGMNREYQMIRLSGKAHRLDDQKLWIDRIFAENPSMNSVYPDDSRYVLEPFY